MKSRRTTFPSLVTGILLWGSVMVLVGTTGPLGWHGTATAQEREAEGTDPDDAARDEARTLFNQGIEQFEAEKYEAALASFQEAYRLAPHPFVRMNMANCYDRLGHPRQAIFHYEHFLNEMGDSAPPDQRREVENALKALRAKVGKLSLEVAPDGAVVRIDGAEERRAPILEAITLPEGKHTVEVALPGYTSTRKEVEVPGGGSTSLLVRLERETAVAQAQPPSEPEGELEEEQDQEQASAPRIEFKSDGERSSGTKALLLGGAITTGVLAVAATVTGLLALQQQNKFDEHRPNAHNPDLPPCQAGDAAACRAAQDDAWADATNAATRANGLALATDILIGGAVVAGTATALLFVLTPKKGSERASKSPSRQVAVTPAMSTTAMGLNLALALD